MIINSDAVVEVESLKYLGFFVQKNGGFDKDMKHRNKCKWIKWREASSVLSNMRISIVDQDKKDTVWTYYEEREIG